MTGHVRAPHRRTGRAPGRRVLPLGVWISIAACLAIAAGAYLLNLRQETQMPEMVIARLSDTQGVVSVQRRGEMITATINMPLLAEDVVRTGQAGTARVSYEREDTSIDIKSDAEARFSEKDGAKRIALARGTVDCRVAAQPADREMVLTTHHAKMIVKGTRFRLSARQATRLDVFEGMVVFSRLPDGEPFGVVAGAFMVAGGSTTDPDVIFQDGFDNGLENWRLVAFRASGQDSVTLDASDRAARERITVKSLSVYDAVSNAVEIKLRKRDTVTVGILLNVPARSYAIEFDTYLDDNTSSELILMPPGRREERMVPIDPPGSTWVRLRTEVREGVNESGEHFFDVTRFRGTVLVEDFRVFTDWVTSGYMVSRGRALVDNVTVRTLDNEKNVNK